jgi:hypothetical protein
VKNLSLRKAFVVFINMNLLQFLYHLELAIEF